MYKTKIPILRYKHAQYDIQTYNIKTWTNQFHNT
jgi:hypothetical protein